MDNLLLWAAIAIVVLILIVSVKKWRQLQRRASRRRGNSYLNQSYDYKYNAEAEHAINTAWEGDSKEISVDNHSEADFDIVLDLDDETPDLDCQKANLTITTDSNEPEAVNNGDEVCGNDRNYENNEISND
ncbi:MAG TPA: hypothetical protein ACFCUY_16525 [Xenococcaceae cyanobacterium]